MRLVYKRRAVRHLEEIHAYIAQHDQEAAKRVIARIDHGQSFGGCASFSAVGRSLRDTNTGGDRFAYVVVHRLKQDRVEIPQCSRCQTPPMLT